MLISIGFQIQDDVLDVVGEENRLGKKPGSDLFMHKQTLLTIKLREKTVKYLLRWIQGLI